MIGWDYVKLLVEFRYIYIYKKKKNGGPKFGPNKLKLGSKIVFLAADRMAAWNNV